MHPDEHEEGSEGSTPGGGNAAPTNPPAEALPTSTDGNDQGGSSTADTPDSGTVSTEPAPKERPDEQGHDADEAPAPAAEPTEPAEPPAE